jgi:hypothetical protein
VFLFWKPSDQETIKHVSFIDHYRRHCCAGNLDAGR